jgi:phosphoglycerate dehydrogenase-like enzyme
MTLLHTSNPARGRVWRGIFAAEAPEIAFVEMADAPDLSTVRYLAAWEPSADLIAQLPALEVLFSVGAGVDQFDMAALPDHVRVVRMIEPGIAEGMVEYVTMAALALHRNLIDYGVAQREGRRSSWSPPANGGSASWGWAIWARRRCARLRRSASPCRAGAGRLERSRASNVMRARVRLRIFLAAQTY